MARIKWDALGSRAFETGIDRCVLYVDGKPSVPWNGVTSIQEKPSGGSQRSYYVDGEKYLQIPSAEEYEATLSAFTYPDEFSVCNGNVAARPGLYVTHQTRKPFNLTYRTFVGNDLDGTEHAYKIHLVYNALASPAQVNYRSLGNSAEASDFNWDISAKPPVMSGYRRTAHVVIDTRTANTGAVSDIEDIIYGTSSENARMITFTEILAAFDANSALTVTDNGDGSFTIVGPDDAITMLDSTTFEITWPTAINVDADTFTISS